MFLEDSQIFHLQFLKIEDYIQNFCHKFHIHNFYEPYTELRSEKFIFSIYSSIFHSQSWKTACFPALGQENRFSDLQTMNFFFSAWNENSTIIKEIPFPAGGFIASTSVSTYSITSVTNQNNTVSCLDHTFPVHFVYLLYMQLPVQCSKQEFSSPLAFKKVQF